MESCGEVQRCEAISSTLCITRRYKAHRCKGVKTSLHAQRAKARGRAVHGCLLPLLLGCRSCSQDHPKGGERQRLCSTAGCQLAVASARHHLRRVLKGSSSAGSGPSVLLACCSSEPLGPRSISSGGEAAAGEQREYVTSMYTH